VSSNPERIFKRLCAERGGVESLDVVQIGVARLLAQILAGGDGGQNVNALETLKGMLPPPKAKRGPDAITVRFVDGPGRPATMLQGENKQLRADLSEAMDAVKRAQEAATLAADELNALKAQIPTAEEAARLRRLRAEAEAPIVSGSSIDTLNRMIGQGGPGSPCVGDFPGGGYFRSW
jgi:hypothetical protein